MNLLDTLCLSLFFCSNVRRQLQSRREHVRQQVREDWTKGDRQKLNTHEDFSRIHEVRLSSDRVFGLVFTGFFLLIGLYPLRHRAPIRLWALVAAGVILLISLTFPRLLRPFNQLWTALGILLNKIVSPIATAVPFFLIFTPMAYLLRWLGKDILRLQMDKSAKSYWIPREPPGPDPKSMANSF